MAGTNYTGSPTSAESPSPAPGQGVAPIVNIPNALDPLTAASVGQAFKTLADFEAWLTQMTPLQMGDGIDGAIVFDGSTTHSAFSSLGGGKYTLSRFVRATDVTFTGTGIVDLNGYGIFYTGTLDITGTGVAGGSPVIIIGAGANASGATHGAGSPAGFFGGGGAGGDGGSGSNGAAGVGNAVAAIGGVGAGGGNASTNTGGPGGSATRPSGANGYLVLPATWQQTGVMFGAAGALPLFGGGGGGGGGGDIASVGGGGGGGGGAGCLVGRTLKLRAATDLKAAGGKGGDAPSGASGGGGSGGGGGGWWIAYVTKVGGIVLTPSVVAPHGVGGNPIGTGASGSPAADGSVQEFVF